MQEISIRQFHQKHQFGAWYLVNMMNDGINVVVISLAGTPHRSEVPHTFAKFALATSGRTVLEVFMPSLATIRTGARLIVFCWNS